MPAEVSPDDARRVGDALSVDWAVVPETTFRHALGVELEHADVTHGDLDMTGRIVLGHLREDPDYYSRLARVEAEAEAYWATRRKPSPTLGGFQRRVGTALIILGVLLIVAGLAAIWWWRRRRGSAHFLTAAPGTFQFWSYDPARSTSNQLDYCEVNPSACPWTW